MSSVVQREMREVSTSMKRVETDGKGMGNVFKSIRGSVAGLFVGMGLAEVARGTVSTVVEFERLRSVLETLEPGQAEARFAALKRFATETPFDLAQVVTAFSKLKAQGLDPSNEAMTAYGNIAAGMGKSLDQFIEAVADSVQGENERLKEFGIKAQQHGDKVTFIFKGVATTVKNNSTEIQKYLQSIGETDFAGAMERQMDTLGGAFSNLGDALANTADEVGKGGLSQALGEITRDMTDAATGTQNWASLLGETLGVALSTIWEMVKTFGQVVADVLSVVGSIFGAFGNRTMSTGDTVTLVFKTISLLINGFGVGVSVIFTEVGGGLKLLGNTFVAFAEIVWKALQFDFSGATARFNQWKNDSIQTARETSDRVTEIMRDGIERQQKILTPPKPQEKPDESTLPGYKPPAPVPRPSTGRNGAASRLQQWRDELQQRIQAEIGYFRDSTDLEIAFWTQKLSQVRRGSKEEVQIRDQLFQLNKKKAQEELDTRIQAINDQQSLLRDDYQRQLELQDQKLAILRDAYGEDSRQYRAAVQEKLRITQQYEQEVVRLERDRIDHAESVQEKLAEIENDANTARIASARDTIQQRQQLGLISERTAAEQLVATLAEEYRMQREHEERIYQLKLQSLQDQLALQNLEPEAKRRVLQDIEMLQLDHQQKMQQLTIQAGQAYQQAQFNVASAIKNQWMQVLSPVSQAFDGFIQSMTFRTQSFGQAILAMADQIVSQFISMGVQMLTNWVANEIAKTTATQVQSGIRTTTEAAANTTSAATAAAAGLTQISTNAAVGASGAFAATAPIPFVGPALAPGVAAAALAAILAFGGMIASAAGGYDIPAGTNPMTQLHEKEMVLPAHIAEPMRRMLAGAGPKSFSMLGDTSQTAGGVREASMAALSAGGGNTFNYQPTHNRSDTDLDSLLRREGAAMRKWFRNEMRNGKFNNMAG